MVRLAPAGISLMTGISLACLFALRGNLILISLLWKTERNHQSAMTDNPPFSEFSISSALRSENSFHMSSLMPVEAIDSAEYFVVDNACLQANGPLNWTLRVQKKPKDDAKLITSHVFRKVRKFEDHEFHVLWDKDLNVTAVDNMTKLGTHMVISHHAAHNNFHLHNNFLLPVYRAFIKSRINGVLLVEGCLNCWRRRLPMMHQVLDMMNLTLIYPLEQAAQTPMCFQRLILPRTAHPSPYYSHDDRFSKFWPRELFRDYRDRLNAYYRTLSIHPVASGGDEVEKPRVNDGPGIETSNERKPVLSWMSRSSTCHGRCITNEKEAVEEFSKYFHVNLLDFGTGLTTEQAVSYIMETDVLIGLHGAGLGFTSLLPDRAMVVELKSRFGKEKALFLNMASSFNLPYYAASLGGCQRIGSARADVFTLPSGVVSVLAKEIFDAYRHEKDSFSRQQSNISTGECHFPKDIKPCGRLSSTKDARCYLRRKSEGAPWRQCMDFNEC